MEKRILLFTFLFVCALSNNLFAQTSVYTLDLANPTVPSEIEYNEKGYWTETYNDLDFCEIEFEKFSFSHFCDGTGWGGMSWYGFTVANNGDNTDYETNWLSNQWGCIAGGGIKTDASGDIIIGENGKPEVEKEIPYLVAFWSAWSESPDNHSLTVSFEEGKTYTAKGFYLNMSPWTYFSNIHGDGFARAFEKGDYLKLFIHGLDGDLNDNGEVVEYMLAEFTDGELIQSSNWEWIDLTSLGEVGGIYFTLETTDIGEYGPNTAFYFCMDKLQIEEANTGIISPVEAQIKVYPNPATEYININTTSSINEVVISDINGRAIYRINDIERSQVSIPVSNWAQGTYIIKVTDRTKVSIHKFIKK